MFSISTTVKAAALALAALALASCETSTVTVGAAGDNVAVSTTVRPGSTSGGTFVARNSMNVVGDPAAAGAFEVLLWAGRGNPDYWCAAADYVKSGLGQPTTTVMFVERGMGPSTRFANTRSVRYTIAPSSALRAQAEKVGSPVSLGINTVGESRTVTHGIGGCKPFNPFAFGFF